MKTATSLLVLGLIGHSVALPGNLKRDEPVADLDRAGKVREAFQTAWKGYRDNAFPHDTLSPVSNGFKDDRSGWGATIFEALSTAIIMGDEQTVAQILEHVPKVNFTTTAKQEGINLYETTTRYLGSLLSSYDLLKGPYKSLAPKSQQVDVLLKQAKTLADSISFVFRTKTGVPDPNFFLFPKPRMNGPNPRNGSWNTLLSEVGTLILEWTRLSDLTGNSTYTKLPQKGQSYIFNHTGVYAAYPGLPGKDISVHNGEFLTPYCSWGTSSDSYYEYLIKMYLYAPKEFGLYKDKWVTAVESSIKVLVSHPTSRPDLTFLGSCVSGGPNVNAATDHLATFAGGNFILGGLLLNKQNYVDLGLQLTDSYFQLYNGSNSGIAPERFVWIDPRDTSYNPPADQADFYAKNGYWTSSPEYPLRAEVAESIYYAYRATGNSKYQDYAWAIFESLLEQTRAGSGFSGLRDTVQANGGEKDDTQQSFFLGETLKYLYLTFADDSVVQFKTKGNEYVFNTKGQPMKIRA